MKHTLTTLLLSLGLAASAQAEWQFGIGGGLGVFDIDGDIEVAGGSGDFDYDTGDVESGFGLNGYAANGNWIIKSSVSYLDAEARQDIGLAQKPKVEFERLIFDLTAGYTFYNENDWKLGAFGGLRYVDFDVDGFGATGSAEDDWTDAVIGATAAYQFAEEWSWVSSLEATFGDSEGTYAVSTGVNWAFAQHWSTSAMLTWKSWEFEGDDSTIGGDYTYDADEIILSLGIMFHF